MGVYPFIQCVSSLYLNGQEPPDCSLPSVSPNKRIAAPFSLNPVCGSTVNQPGPPPRTNPANPGSPIQAVFSSTDASLLPPHAHTPLPLFQLSGWLYTTTLAGETDKIFNQM